MRHISSTVRKSHTPELICASGSGRTGDLVLTGDIGGTNSRLQLWEMVKGEALTGEQGSEDGVTVPGTLLLERKYPNEEHENFEAVWAKFRDAAAEEQGVGVDEPISVAAVAVAGFVDNDTVEFTNRKEWSFCARQIEQRRNVGRAKLVNDFVSNGYGLLTLGTKDLHCLQEGEKKEGAPIVLVGAGTGLGECFLTPHNGVYQCWPSEGGHAEYSPRSKVELQLLSSLMDKFHANHRVSVERIVSGTGIANVYGFLRNHYSGLVNKLVDDEIMATGDQRGGMVAMHYHDDVLCKWTMQIVFGTYGSEAGAMALRFMPFGGLYIAGGLAPKNMHMFTEEWETEGTVYSFMNQFRDKGRLSPVLEKIPVNVVLNENIGLRGTHLLAWRMLNNVG